VLYIYAHTYAHTHTHTHICEYVLYTIIEQNPGKLFKNLSDILVVQDKCYWVDMPRE